MRLNQPRRRGVSSERGTVYLSYRRPLLSCHAPAADGTITDEERQVLTEIGAWMDVNGEGIYDTTYWKTFGEGPTQVKEGAFSDTDREPFTSRDVRYTYKKSVVYAFVMRAPEDGVAHLESFKTAENGWNDLKVREISLLGEGEPLEFARSFEEMTVKLKNIPQTDKPICLKILID